MIELLAATAKDSAAATGAAAIAVAAAAAMNSGAMNFREAIMYPVYHFPLNLKHRRAAESSVPSEWRRRELGPRIAYEPISSRYARQLGRALMAAANAIDELEA